MVDAANDLKDGKEYVIAVQDWLAAQWGNSNKYYLLQDSYWNNGGIGLQEIQADDIFRGIYHNPPETELEVGSGYDEYLKQDFTNNLSNELKWRLIGTQGDWRLQNTVTNNYLTLRGVNSYSIEYSFGMSQQDGWNQYENYGYGVNYSNHLHITGTVDGMASISSKQNWDWPTPDQPEQYLNLQNGNTPVATAVPEWAAQFKFFTPVKETLYSYVIHNIQVPEPVKDEVVSITVSKDWVGKAKDSVQVYLLADGERIGSITLDSSNDWKHTFAGLEKYKDGEQIVYTLEEDTPEGYQSSLREMEKEEKTHWVMVDAQSELESGKQYAIATQDWMKGWFGESNVYYFITDMDGTIGLSQVNSDDVFRGVYHIPQEEALTLGKEYKEYLEQSYADEIDSVQLWILTQKDGFWMIQNAETGKFLTLKGDNNYSNPVYSFITSIKDGWYASENYGQGVNYSNVLTLQPGNDGSGMVIIGSQQQWGWPTPPQAMQYIQMQNGNYPVAVDVLGWAAQFKFFKPISEIIYTYKLTNTEIPEEPEEPEQPDKPQEPQEPEQPEEPEQPQEPRTPEVQKVVYESKAPATGDFTPITMYALTLVAAVCILAVCVKKKMK